MAITDRPYYTKFWNIITTISELDSITDSDMTDAREERKNVHATPTPYKWEKGKRKND